MKSSQPHACWSVESITRGDKRRAITFSRKLSGNGSQSCAAKAPRAGQPKDGRKLRVRFGNEKLSAFQPLVQRPATVPAEPRIVMFRQTDPWHPRLDEHGYQREEHPKEDCHLESDNHEGNPREYRLAAGDEPVLKMRKSSEAETCT